VIKSRERLFTAFYKNNDKTVKSSSFYLISES